MSDSPEKTIRDFLKKIAEQDNRSTRSPYFYVIRSEIRVSAPACNADEIEVYWDGDTYESMEALEEYLEKNEYSENQKDDVLSEAEEYGIRKEWKESGMFLTETDAERHLEANYYHYSKNAHTYVKHSWRAPELKDFIQALFKHFEVDKGNLDL